MDFGFAKFIEEEVGLKTKTKFVGTYTYVTDEIKQLYNLTRFGYVDFYYNDLFGLEKVISL